MGAPAPDSLIKALGLGLSTLGTISKTIDKYPKHTVGQLVAVLALGVGQTTMAGLLAEAAVVAGAFLAAFYFGVVIGCLITAAIEYFDRQNLRRRYGYKMSQMLDAGEKVQALNGIPRVKIKQYLIKPEVRMAMSAKGRVNYAVA